MGKKELLIYAQNDTCKYIIISHTTNTLHVWAETQQTSDI